MLTFSFRLAILDCILDCYRTIRPFLQMCIPSTFFPTNSQAVYLLLGLPHRWRGLDFFLTPMLRLGTKVMSVAPPLRGLNPGPFTDWATAANANIPCNVFLPFIYEATKMDPTCPDLLLIIIKQFTTFVLLDTFLIKNANWKVNHCQMRNSFWSRQIWIRCHKAKEAVSISSTSVVRRIGILWGNNL